MSFAVGSLVRTRGREWVVLPESDDELVMVRPLGGTDAEVTGILTDLEKVEPATFAPPDPEHPGDHRSAQLLRDALVLGFRDSAGPFRSVGHLAVTPRPYQLVPLLMALRQDIVRLLIADDVGIGKTIEAALIARELLDQGDIARTCVLCPPHLAKQWQAELAEKFHIDAQLVLASTAAALERQLPRDRTIFDEHPHVVVSIDFIKSDRRRDEFVRTCPGSSSSTRRMFGADAAEHAPPTSATNRSAGVRRAPSAISTRDRRRTRAKEGPVPVHCYSDFFAPEFAHLPESLAARRTGPPEHPRRHLVSAAARHSPLPEADTQFRGRGVSELTYNCGSQAFLTRSWPRKASVRFAPGSSPPQVAGGRHSGCCERWLPAPPPRPPRCARGLRPPTVSRPLRPTRSGGRPCWISKMSKRLPTWCLAARPVRRTRPWLAGSAPWPGRPTNFAGTPTPSS